MAAKGSRQARKTGAKPNTRTCPRCEGSGRVPVDDERRADVKPSNCSHPINRRIGKTCAACGATP